MSGLQAAALGVYQRHRPETTALYEVVRDNLETLYGVVQAGDPKHLRGRERPLGMAHILDDLVLEESREPAARLAPHEGQSPRPGTLRGSSGSWIHAIAP